MRALVTGITGQDGSYLAELLLARGYEVHGLVRRASAPNRSRLAKLIEQTDKNRLILHSGDLSEPIGLINIIRTVRPLEVYNLAAQSDVGISFQTPDYTGQVTALGALHLLEAVRSVDPGIRFYQASSSELFGASPPPQSEVTNFHPRSPYAVAKLYSYWATRNYREAYGMYAVNGILFNHESPRRGENFVTRKISLAVAQIKLGLREQVQLGNLNARRDWGYAPEFVEGMWAMLQQEEPQDFVLGTGTSFSVEDFANFAFAAADLDWRDYVAFDPSHLRPAEVDNLIADPRKAAEILGWASTVTAPQLAEIMVEADLNLTRRSGTSLQI